MKKNILKSIAFVLLMGLAWSCSNESDVSTQPSEIQTKNASILDGIIATERNGEYVIAVDEQKLIHELELILEQEQGYFVQLSTVSIQQKTATDNPANSSYFLIGSTVDLGDATTSIGARLDVANGGLYISANTLGGNYLGCRGCATGCFIEYYNIDGHYVLYCNSAGCGKRCKRWGKS